MVLKEMRRVCSDEEKPIIPIKDIHKIIMQQITDVAAKEEANPGTIATLMKYLSAMGMVRHSYKTIE